MVSSLLHVLVVTPVLFLWLHERRLRAADTTDHAVSMEERTMGSRASHARRAWLVVGVVVLATAAVSLWWFRAGAGSGEIQGEVVRTIRAGDLEIVVTAPDGVLRPGANAFTLQFRSSATGDAVDVGTVRIAAVMNMPGMAMSADVAVRRGTRQGQYLASGQLAMAGTWNMTVEWDGPAGKGSAPFEGDVR
jgi:hypothetical protein